MKKKLKSTATFWLWLDKHILELLTGFLIAFLPLYPKLPLFDALPGYIVRVRLEDLIIFFSLIIFTIQLFRKKISLQKNLLFKPIVLYLAIGLLSSLSAIFITKTVPAETLHVGKLFLHWARRVEYMSLAIIAFAAITSRQSLKRILWVAIITAAIVSLYGFGQKYFAWPVYSTMNREFSKGWRLVLTKHARVSSTFAGHYDLAAYNVIILPLLASLAIVTKSRLQKLTYFSVFIIGFAILLLTASRSSFISYIGALTFLGLALNFKLGVRRAISSWLVFMLISAIGFYSFGSIRQRFEDIPIIRQVQTTIAQTINRFSGPIKLATGDPNQPSTIVSQTDTQPSVPENNLPADVYEAIPEAFPEATLSAIPSTGDPDKVNKQREFSQAAETYGLSSAIRFDALWPKALAGFRTNPLLGSGYSTLLKDQVTDFTEAESTDNDYLRALGETGLLGLLSFYGIFAFSLWHISKALLATKEPTEIAFYSAIIAGLLGILVNALYIDVFEASKVAYTLWALIGVAFGYIAIDKPSKTK